MHFPAAQQLTEIRWRRYSSDLGSPVIHDLPEMPTEVLDERHITYATREAGAVAQRAEHLNISKYTHYDSSHHFIPSAVETSGVFGP